MYLEWLGTIACLNYTADNLSTRPVLSVQVIQHNMSSFPQHTRSRSISLVRSRAVLLHCITLEPDGSRGAEDSMLLAVSMWDTLYKVL